MTWRDTAVGLFERQRAYVEHTDPAAAAANLVAVVVALNGPLYPIYVIALVGLGGVLSLLTMIASPLFFAVPWIARRSSLAGRAALPLIGTVNTVWCTKLFGPASGVQLFCFPCIMLAALVFRGGERWLGVLLVGLAIIPLLLPASLFGVPVMPLAADDAARLGVLNLIGVAMLMGLIALQFMSVLAASTKAPLSS